MKILKITIISFFLGLSLMVYSNEPYLMISEEKEKKNEAYLQLGGVTGLFSFNYERKIFAFKERFEINIRGFISAISLFDGLGTDYWIGGGVNIRYLLSDKAHFHLGGGQLIYNYNVLDFFEDEGKKNITEYMTYFSVGYTQKITKSGWFLKASYTPLLLYNEPEYESVKFQSWGGISIGKRF